MLNLASLISASIWKLEEKWMSEI